jgi:thiol-disulfide isomerase/thioredoxin
MANNVISGRKVFGTDMKEYHLKSPTLRGHLKGVKKKKTKVEIGWRCKATKIPALNIIIVIVIIVVISLTIFFWPVTVEIGTNVGNKPPNFTLSDPDGFKYTLYQYIEDDKRPLLLEFMNTNRSACRQMAPVLHDLYENYSGKVDFLSVASGSNDDKYNVKTFMASYGSQWPYLLDKSPRVFDEWKLRKYPTFFIIKKDGTISWTDWDSNRGVYSYNEMAEMFDAVT